MSRLEIIHLRTSGEPASFLGKRISEAIGSEVDSPEVDEVVTIYRRDGIETDVAVHIHSHEGPESKGQSVLGLLLASELRAYGLVEHSVWVEETPS